MGLIADLTAIADSLYGIRDDLGAAVHNVYVLTRTWSGTSVGDGRAFDETEQLLPTPALKNLSHDFDAQKAGTVKAGDIILKGISKQSHPTEDEVSLKASSVVEQKFYLIADKLYQVISNVENYISWDVYIRKLTHQTRYATVWGIFQFTVDNDPVDGQFKLQYGTAKTAFISFEASAEQVQTALRLVSGLSQVEVECLGPYSFSVSMVGVHTPTLTVADSTLEDADEEVVTLVRTTLTAYSYTVTN